MRFLFCLWQLWRSRDEGPDLVVDRSTTGLNSGGFGGRSVDETPAQRTHQDTMDELKQGEGRGFESDLPLKSWVGDTQELLGLLSVYRSTSA